MTAVQKKKYTIEEYVELVKTAEGRFEYFDGEVFDRAGGKMPHGEIASNVIYQLRSRLQGRDCRVYGSNVAIKVPAAWPFRFPDVSAVCGEKRIEDFRGIDLLLNPVLLVEVLSHSTATYDVTDKLTAYQSIASFREYLAIAQTHPYVLHHTKQPNGLWLRRDITGIDESIELASLSLTLGLREIYEAVTFPPEQVPVLKLVD